MRAMSGRDFLADFDQCQFGLKLRLYCCRKRSMIINNAKIPLESAASVLTYLRKEFRQILTKEKLTGRDH